MDDEDRLLTQSLEKRFSGLISFVPVFEKRNRLEPWHSNIVGAIPLRVRLNYLHLRQAAKANYEYLGWCSRNLLELLIWAMYVTKDRENARRLFEDYIIDSEHLVTNLRTLLQTVATHPHPEIDRNLEILAAHDVILQGERKKSALEDENKYLDVGRVAKEMGMGKMFSSLNRIYSKLAHPTSLSILLTLPPEPDAQIRSFMFRMSLIAAKDSLDVMCEYFVSLGIETDLIEDKSLLYTATLRANR